MGYLVGVLAILALAAVLRLGASTWREFSRTKASCSGLAEDWVRLGRMPLAGMPASVGVPLPPWFIYIVAPAVALSRDQCGDGPDRPDQCGRCRRSDGARLAPVSPWLRSLQA